MLLLANHEELPYHECMDQVSVQLPQPPKPKKNNFLFLEIGLFEMGFVVMLLTITFSTLNYFHVITLPQPSTLLPTLFPKKNPPLSDKQLQNNLTTFVLSTLKSPYQPQSYTFQKTTSGNIVTISSTWQQQGSSFTAKLTYDQSTNTQTGINLQTTISSPSAEATSRIAQKLFVTYFIGFTPQATNLGCYVKKENNSFICFSPYVGNKNGNISYQTTVIPNLSLIILSTCQKTGTALDSPGCSQER